MHEGVPHAKRVVPPVADTPVRADAISRACGGIGLFGVATTSVIWLVVQFLRPDVNWLTVTMSVYVLGPDGAWARAAFLVAAPSLAALGVGLYRALHPPTRSAAALALFITAAAALCFAGAFVTDTTAWPVTLHGAIHQWAAFTTFVCVMGAMTLQSWLFRDDLHWRHHFPGAFAIAMLTIVYFWIYALFHPIPRGVGEKVMIGLVLLWVWRTAWWLVRG